MHAARAACIPNVLPLFSVVAAARRRPAALSAFKCFYQSCFEVRSRSVVTVRLAVNDVGSLLHGR